MTFPLIQNSFVSGELSPSLLGRTDKVQYKNGASTMRNFFVSYKGGAVSRAGFAYVGMCKQGAPNAGGTSTSNPPRDINFQYNINQGFALEFGDQYMRVKYRGAYVTEAGTSISAATNANPLVITDTAHGYNNGDWVYVSGIGGMTQLNGLTWIVANKTTNTYQLTDLFGTTVNSTAFGTYTSGGTAARIYTVVSPYAAVDLPYLKFTQSANTMNFACYNQQTLADYRPYNLVRVGNTNWVFTAVSFASAIAPPGGVTATATNSTTQNTWYSYVVTAVDINGNESVASTAVDVLNNDINVNAGTNTIKWTAVVGATQYNVYAAIPAFTLTPFADPGFVGVSYGLIGSATGIQFIDTNIIPDFTRTPPIHTNPFPSTTHYPGTVQYFQQRLVYANTIAQPDTYFMSQPGLYANFDGSIPTVDSDSITGTPWGVQVNGIQFLIPTITGLLTFMGNGVWLISGAGNPGTAITPSNQNAQAQAQIGCSAVVPPLFINSHILYVQAKNSVVRDINYSFLSNTFQGTDITVFSSHLFFGYTLSQWAYAEEPFKIIWAVRNDGAMLSLTYVKEQEIEGWSRHDTNGAFIGVCSVIEPPVDALYVITKRYITGKGVFAYYSERADDRQWSNVEDAFCVDAGLTLPMTFPNATLSPAAANGTGNITSVNLITGGHGYAAPIITAIDNNGVGLNATFTYALSGGVITSITPLTTGQNYPQGTSLQITDSTGSGAVAQAIVTNIVSFTASVGVFNSGMVGNVIRADGGKAIVTSYISGTSVMANIVEPLTTVTPNDPNFMPVPVIAGEWSIAVPTTTVTGLNHLEGMQVTGLADGGVIVPQMVVNGSIVLQNAASAITVGLPFIAQLQSFYMDPPAQTTAQGKRANISAVTVRLEQSRGIEVGSNQPDSSFQPNNAAPAWTNMIAVKERNALINAGSAIPLYSGDTLPILIPGDWDSRKQVAIQARFPLPCSVLAVIPHLSVGDGNG